MKPMPLAIKSYKKLIKKYDVYILSTAPWENHSAWSDKLWWIQKYLGNKIAYKNLIITHHKELNIGNFLIDDRYKNGAREFTGKHIKFNSKNRNEWCRILKILNIK
jgi:5'(3')-deoxyribonucleotidase